MKNFIPKLIVTIAAVLAFGAVQQEAMADTATWNQDPTSGDWNTAANWTPEIVPNGVNDHAVFDRSATTAVSLSATTQVKSILFDVDASAFTISTSPDAELILFGAGIVNDSSEPQNFVVGVGAALINFEAQASAGANTFFSNSGSVQFNNKATAASATIVNNGETQSGGPHGTTLFLQSSNAGTATLITNSATGSGTAGGIVSFSYTSSAAGATIINNPGGTTSFAGPATAGSALLIANGGTIEFLTDADGGTAQVEVTAAGELSLTARVGPPLTIGSLEGDGYAFLGGNRLIVGSNSLSTTFAGLIAEGSGGVSGGSISKIGTGRFTMSGDDTYTGDTTVSEGALVVSNTSGSATGAGPVAVNGGTLGGGGTISGAVTVGTGSGSGATLQPSSGTNKKIALTIQSLLTLKSDSSYNFHLKSPKAEVVANGLTIESGAQFVLAAPKDKLRAGIRATVISNTSSSPISGTFANLADGATITSGGNTYQANYEGGDGNDLTLTVVP